jgi:hypothetical protein
MTATAATTELLGIQIELHDEPRSASTFFQRHLPWIVLLVLAVIFRLPPLINAAATHSDAAIVGLQAMHLLTGEWSWFIWGAPYQGALDVWLTAILFALTGGPGPLKLMLVPLLGHLLLIWLAFDVLRRRIDPCKAFILCLALIFTPQAINGVALYLPRQWSITLVFLSVWMLDRASESKREWLWFAAAGFATALAIYADLFTAVFMPGLGLLAAGCVVEDRPGLNIMMRRAIEFAAALGIGLLLYWLVRHIAAMPPSPKTQLNFERVGVNWHLLLAQCLPWAMSYGIYVPGEKLYPDRWSVGGLDAFHIAAASLFGVLMLIGAATVFVPRFPWKLRRLAAFGIASSVASIVLFLLSVMPLDMWGARYLAPIIWAAPFALAPVTLLMTRRQLAMLFGPYVFCAALGGWLSYGPYVHGIKPVVTTSGSGKGEQELARFLRDSGIKKAAAQYWLAYRLTFLFNEDPIVFPPAEVEDRYAPYRQPLEDVRAFIVHPSEPRLRPEPIVQWLNQRGKTWRPFEVGGYTIIKVQQ